MLGCLPGLLLLGRKGGMIFSVYSFSLGLQVKLDPKKRPCVSTRALASWRLRQLLPLLLQTPYYRQAEAIISLSDTRWIVARHPHISVTELYALPWLSGEGVSYCTFLMGCLMRVGWLVGRWRTLGQQKDQTGSETSQQASSQRKPPFTKRSSMHYIYSKTITWNALKFS